MEDPKPPAIRSRRRSVFLAVVVVALVVVAAGIASSLYTEALWFDELGASTVFSTVLWTKIGLAAAFGAVFVVLLVGNVWIARRITSAERASQIPDEVLSRYRATLQPYAKLGSILIVALGALVAGSRAAGRWSDYQLWRHAVPFNRADPVLGKDLGFYVFKYPFLRFVFGWAVAALVVTIIAAVVAHYTSGGIRPQRRGERIAAEARAHLSVLVGLLVLLKAWGYRLDEYRLVFSPRGVVAGATYADIHARLPLLRGLVIVAIIAAVLLFLNARVRTWMLPIAASIVLGLTSAIGGGIYPAAVQRLKVRPDEQALERSSIQRNIVATRAAFGIDAVQHHTHPGVGTVDARTVARDEATLDNIRLWSPDVLRSVYANLQRVKRYYQFVSPADVDRYEIDGTSRELTIGAREISPNGLSPDAKTWVNTHLFYTHGYGAVANGVEEVAPPGQPEFLLKDIPPDPGTGAPSVTTPQIYFGENAEIPYVIVPSDQQELDHPTSDAGTVTTRYDGRGGISIGSFVRRAAFAVRFRDLNIVISGAINDRSRLMFRRQIYDRVSRVAPFVTLDGDPYIAIADGRLVWLLDGYTTASTYPSAQPSNFSAASGGLVPGSGNYIRNSVKFVVDAKDGTVRGYVWDPADPVLAAWTRIFPGLLQPRASMPASIARHVRYPQGLLRIQSEMYADYHVTDADTLYQKEDEWLVARDPTVCVNAATACRGGGPPVVPPYYMLVDLPGVGERFALVRPFTPAGGDRQNMVAYLAADGDDATYGRLYEYDFPRARQVLGPEQIQASINQDPAVSQQVSLWNQQNSKVIYGDLLIVPLPRALLYVQPLYLSGAGSQIPQLKRVVVVANGRVKMADTLREALDELVR
ncbi:MAG: UPF0182 family protein [Actinomycetota bacterium]